MTTKMTIENIFKYKTGLNISEVANLSLDGEKSLVKQRTGRNLVFSIGKRDHRKLGRGNPLLARKRIRTMSDVDKRLDELGKRKK